MVPRADNEGYLRQERNFLFLHAIIGADSTSQAAAWHVDCAGPLRAMNVF